MTRIIAAALVLVALSTIPTMAEDVRVGTKQALPKGVAASCVRVGTNNGMGSGTVIGRKGKTALILTNAHVIPNGDRKIYIISGGERFPGTWVASLDEDDADLALVTAEIPNPAAVIAAESAPKGTKIRHYGGATGPQKGQIIGETNWIRKGVVNPSIKADLFSIVGDSGSAYFNDGDEIVGVHNAREGDPEKDETMANGVRLDQVRKFTAARLKGWETQTFTAK